jgi:hypothetical protein
MVFSSIFFLFAFLPLVILGYYGQYLLLNNRLRNLFLLVVSYLFYLFGAPDFILFLAGSTLFDYAMGRLMDRFERQKRIVADPFCIGQPGAAGLVQIRQLHDCPDRRPSSPKWASICPDGKRWPCRWASPFSPSRS